MKGFFRKYIKKGVGWVTPHTKLIWGSRIFLIYLVLYYSRIAVTDLASYINKEKTSSVIASSYS